MWPLHAWTSIFSELCSRKGAMSRRAPGDAADVLSKFQTAGQSKFSAPLPTSAHIANGFSELFAAIAAPITAREIKSTNVIIAALRNFLFHMVFSLKCRFSHITSDGGFAVVIRNF